mmetsp:Transcript_11594/g.15958  ORF Transcript_11594/g.15958 Transcript_11594/m.15958 type:complete len:195 (-) Transcript_11594:1408-1992(-)
MFNIFVVAFIICHTHAFSGISKSFRRPTMRIQLSAKNTIASLTAAVGIFYLSPWDIAISSNKFDFIQNCKIQPASADSTGKMSTKLTARKRYLPRIVEGYKLFQALLSNPSVDKIDSFSKDELPGLKRAMNLYGASLRKGEVPDEISREAEQLTASFESSFLRWTKAKDLQTDLQTVDAAFKAYLSFAKIDPSS